MTELACNANAEQKQRPRTQKSQLALDQPWAEGSGTHQKKKRIPYVQRQSRCCNEMVGGPLSIKSIKSNFIPTGWATHKLKNNNTKGVLPLLWRFWAPCQASQPGNLPKGLGLPSESDFEGQWYLITELHRTGETETIPVEGRNKILYVPSPEERSSDPIGNWMRPTC